MTTTNYSETKAAAGHAVSVGDSRGWQAAVFSEAVNLRVFPVAHAGN